MKIFVVFVLIFHCVCGDSDFEKCESYNGIERKCMPQEYCPEEVATLDSNMMRKLKITSCGYSGWKRCCPLPECYTWDGRPGKCHNFTEDGLFSELNLKQMLDSACLGKPGMGCYSQSPIRETTDCSKNYSAFPPYPLSGCCGQPHPGGLYALPSSFFIHPWFALLKYPSNNNRHCSGVLISANYVLASAHCVDFALPTEKPYAVVLGKNNKDSTEDCLADAPCYDTVRETREIEEIVVHPDFSTSPVRTHDIALIRLMGIVVSSAFVKPICLPIDLRDVTRWASSDFQVHSVAWGAHHEDYQPTINRKRQVPMQFVKWLECKKSYSNLKRVQICATEEADPELCIGDNGGPLMRNRSGTFEILGIPSLSSSACGVNNTPTVYTNVFQYAAWIRNTIRP